MNTLENLNNWSNDDIPYAGNATYSITFDPTSPVNQTASVIEDQAFVSPVGTNITSMVSTPRNIQYTIDLSGIALPATINWGTLPYFISSQVAGTNIFRLVGPIDENVWAQVKSPSITIPDQATTFTYPATITYPDPSNTNNDLTKTWDVTVSVTSVPNISTPSPYVYTKNSIGTISGTPEILNLAAGTYTILITPSQTSYVYLLGSSGSGGTVTFDPVLKTLTISGTKTQVNSHLASVQLTPGTNVQNPFTLAYTLTNPSGAQNTVNQSLTSSEAFTISAGTYLEDTAFSLGYGILDTSTTATSFTVSVAQATPLPSVSPGFFTVNGSNVGNTWTASNTKANINAANVIFTPPLDYTGTITMNVNQSKVDNGNVVVQATNSGVNIINAGTNTEVVNMINRSYTGSQTNTLFPTQIPSITDGPDTGQTYTITLSSDIGRIGNSQANAIASASYSFTGNKTACNAEFANIKFLPEDNSAPTGTFTYTQTRASTLQVDLNLTLTGTPGNITNPVYQAFTGNANITLTWEQVYYGNVRILVVAGGGAGSIHSVVTGNTIQGGGGGEAGQVIEVVANTGTANALTEGTYSVVVGSGANNASTGNAYSGTNSYITKGGTNYFVAAGGEGARSGGNGGGILSTYHTPGHERLYINTNGNSAPTSTDKAYVWGGRGGGSGQPYPTNYTTVTISYPVINSTYQWYNFGPEGLTSNITGTNINYGPGGYGGQSNPGSTTAGLPGRGGGSVAYANGQINTNGASTVGGGGGGQGAGLGTPPGSYAGQPGSGGSGIVVIKIT